VSDAIFGSSYTIIDTLFDLFLFVIAGVSLTMKDLYFAFVVAAAAFFLGVDSQCSPGSVPGSSELVSFKSDGELFNYWIVLIVTNYHENLNIQHEYI
jgi:hypothetical protein